MTAERTRILHSHVGQTLVWSRLRMRIEARHKHEIGSEVRQFNDLEIRILIDTIRMAREVVPPCIPTDVRASILEMCQVIDKGSTSALFGRVHDVRRWIGER